MSRLPQPGSDGGTWGDILNDFLQVAHNSDGTIDASGLTTATTSSAGTMSATDKTKLDGIQTNATANSSDATLLNRANHTGTQAQSTITNLVTDLSNKIPASLVNAKGDLLVGTANDTVDRLAVGTNGKILKANDATASGLEWADESGAATAAEVAFTPAGSIGANNVQAAIEELDDTVSGLGGSIVLFNYQTGTSYTLALSDAGKLVEIDTSSANTVTIPTNASVAFPIGTEVGVAQVGAGVTTIVAAGGVTVRFSPGVISGHLGGAGAIVGLIKRGVNDWWVTGDMANG